MSEIYFYSLRNTSPELDYTGKEVWSIPEASSPEDALKYFASETGYRLKLIDDLDEVGEFSLEQFERILTQNIASTGIQPGNKVSEFWVERIMS